GHEGLFSISGQPTNKAGQLGLAVLAGSFKTAVFRLVAESGNTIKPITLEKQGHPDAAEDEFVGLIELPTQPFQVAVSGVDNQGKPYDITFPTVFRLQP